MITVSIDSPAWRFVWPALHPTRGDSLGEVIDARLLRLSWPADCRACTWPDSDVIGGLNHCGRRSLAKRVMFDGLATVAREDLPRSEDGQSAVKVQGLSSGAMPAKSASLRVTTVSW